MFEVKKPGTSPTDLFGGPTPSRVPTPPASAATQTMPGSATPSTASGVAPPASDYQHVMYGGGQAAALARGSTPPVPFAPTATTQPRVAVGQFSRAPENLVAGPMEQDLLAHGRVGSAPGQLPPHELQVVRDTVATKSHDLTDTQRDAHLHAQGAMHRDQWGERGDARPDLVKVIPGGGGLLSGRFPSAVSGSIGYSRAVEGMGTTQTLQTFGLDYNDSRYTTGNGGDPTNQRRQFNTTDMTYVEFSATDGMADPRSGLAVNLAPDMLARQQALSNDALAQFPSSSYPGKAADTDPRTPGNAYRGTAISGTNMAVGMDTVNQELTTRAKPGKPEEAQALGLPMGARMLYRDDDPRTPDEHVATFNAQTQGWTYNAACDPAILLRYKKDELGHLDAMRLDAEARAGKAAREVAMMTQQKAQLEAQAAATADAAGVAAARSQVAKLSSDLQAAHQRQAEAQQQLASVRPRLASLQADIKAQQSALAIQPAGGPPTQGAAK